MKAVVSGASGFLGSSLVPELANRGFDQVFGLILEKDILAKKQDEYADDDSISFVASDDWDGTRVALKDADVLIHCAFPRAQAAEYLAGGLKYGNDLFIAAREAGCKAVINISSQSVYDAHRNYAATEESPLVLDTTYAVAKYASELMLNDVYEGLPHTSVRLASLIGPGFDQRVPNKLITKAINGDQIILDGGCQVFDYLDVKDAANMITSLAISNGLNWQNTYNLGSMQPRTLIEVAEAIVQLVRSRGFEVNQPQISPNSTYSNSSLDCSAIKALIGTIVVKTTTESYDSIIIEKLAELENTIV